MKYDLPHPDNFCGGNFQDWLEVNLTSYCNGKCSWCIEKIGIHPKEIASWQDIAEAALSTNKTNIILLGGEPTLYSDIKLLIQELVKHNKKVWITTNASLLNKKYIEENIKNITGINMSIHHYDLLKNKEIVHVELNRDILKEIIDTFKNYNIQVRFNCNLIKGYIDSKKEILKYIRWVKKLGCNNIRFAELKLDTGHFIDLAKEFNYKYGLNDDPYKKGCFKEAIINGVNINFRQMCGFQINKRPKVLNPKQYSKQVLYYDGKIYNGWQQKSKEKILVDILNEVSSNPSSIEDAINSIVNLIKD